MIDFSAHLLNRKNIFPTTISELDCFLPISNFTFIIAAILKLAEVLLINQKSATYKTHWGGRYEY